MTDSRKWIGQFHSSSAKRVIQHSYGTVVFILFNYIHAWSRGDVFVFQRLTRHFSILLIFAFLPKWCVRKWHTLWKSNTIIDWSPEMDKSISYFIWHIGFHSLQLYTCVVSRGMCFRDWLVILTSSLMHTFSIEINCMILNLMNAILSSLCIMWMRDFIMLSKGSKQTRWEN